MSRDFRVLFIYPNTEMATLVPANLSVLAPSLKEKGFQVDLFDTTYYKWEDTNYEQKKVELLQIKPFSYEEKGKRWLLKELENVSFKTIDTKANFIHVDCGKYKDNILRLFEENNMLIHDGPNVKGFENYARITTGPKLEMEKVVDCVKLALLAGTDL